jgi:hypothetical protein
MMSKSRTAGSMPTVRAGGLGVLALFLMAAFAPIQSARADSATSRPMVVAQADGLPSLEFAQGCREAAAGDAKVLNSCMHDEQQARQKLSTQWETYQRGDRTECTALARLGGRGVQSYVELITCLEMAKDARALPKSAKE